LINTAMNYTAKHSWDHAASEYNHMCGSL